MDGQAHLLQKASKTFKTIECFPGETAAFQMLTRLDMEKSLIKPADDTVWYENDHPIQEFLESYRKPAILETDHQAEELSWIKIVENSI